MGCEFKMLLLFLFIATNQSANITIKNHKDIEAWWIAFYLQNLDLSCGGTITNVEITDNNLYSTKWVSFDSSVYETYGHCAFLHQQAIFTAPLTIRITKNNPPGTIIANNIIKSFTPDQQYDFGSNFIHCPTLNATIQPTISPTNNPFKQPTATPTKFPTKNPTAIPTVVPSKTPTQTPSYYPTITPTKIPTNFPSFTPTNKPTNNPTLLPSFAPTKIPTKIATNKPTVLPSFSPTNVPSPSVLSGQVYNIETTVHYMNENVSKSSEKMHMTWIYVCLTVMTVVIITIIGLVICYYKSYKKNHRNTIVLQTEMKNISSQSSEQNCNLNQSKSQNFTTPVFTEAITPESRDKNILEYALTNTTKGNESSVVNVNILMEGHVTTLENETNSDNECEDLYGDEFEENNDYETPIGTRTNDGSETVQ